MLKEVEEIKRICMEHRWRNATTGVCGPLDKIESIVKLMAGKIEMYESLTTELLEALKDVKRGVEYGIIKQESNKINTHFKVEIIP